MHISVCVYIQPSVVVSVTCMILNITRDPTDLLEILVPRELLEDQGVKDPKDAEDPRDWLEHLATLDPLEDQDFQSVHKIF